MLQIMIFGCVCTRACFSNEELRTSSPDNTELGKLMNASVSVTGTTPDLPSGDVATFGWWTFTITGLTAGQEVVVQLTFPSTIPTDAVLVKYCGTGSPSAYGDVLSTSGNVMTVRLTDGGTGDCDGSANGQITDPQAPVVHEILPTPVFPLDTILAVIAPLSDGAICNLVPRG